MTHVEALADCTGPFADLPTFAMPPANAILIQPPRRATSPRAATRPAARIATDAADRSASAMRGVALGLALRHRRVRGSTTEAQDLLIADAERALELRLRAHLPSGHVRVILTDNRYTMISVRRLPKEQRHELRLHHMFAEADPVIVRALARYAADNDRAASRVLGDFIDDNQPGPGRSKRDLLVTAGEVHDLREIFDDLNARYFGGTIDARITWGPRVGAPRRRNSIKMGSYVVEDRLIRMHRGLDRAWVPRFFIAWIVFHEMLHQVHGVGRKGGRREFHSPAFLADEARFEHFAAAKAWERGHLEELLCA